MNARGAAQSGCAAWHAPTNPMSDPHPHSRAGLEQRFGARYRWYVLLTVMIGTIVLRSACEK